MWNVDKGIPEYRYLDIKYLKLLEVMVLLDKNNTLLARSTIRELSQNSNFLRYEIYIDEKRMFYDSFLDKDLLTDLVSNFEYKDDPVEMLTFLKYLKIRILHLKLLQYAIVC